MAATCQLFSNMATVWPVNVLSTNQKPCWNFDKNLWQNEVISWSQAAENSMWQWHYLDLNWRCMWQAGAILISVCWTNDTGVPQGYNRPYEYFVVSDLIIEALHIYLYSCGFICCCCWWWCWWWRMGRLLLMSSVLGFETCLFLFCFSEFWHPYIYQLLLPS